MKKQYMIPNMTVVKIGATVLQPASSFDKNPETVSNGNEILSRGFWDFDEDEEE